MQSVLVVRQLTPSRLIAVRGAPGGQGRDIELQASSTHIQWRSVGDVAWTNLLPIAALEIELQVTATHIQWRAYSGAWANLIALEELTGEPGASARSITSVAIDANKHLIVTFSDGSTQDAGVLPSSDEVAALQQTVADLLARIEVLESYHAIPTNALADASGEPLVDANGDYLTLGAVA